MDPLYIGQDVHYYGAGIVPPASPVAAKICAITPATATAALSVTLAVFSATGTLSQATGVPVVVRGSTKFPTTGNFCVPLANGQGQAPAR